MTHGSGLKYSFTSIDLDFNDLGALATAKLGPPLAPPVNDNVRLYGATPGSAIVLPDENPRQQWRRVVWREWRIGHAARSGLRYGFRRQHGLRWIEWVWRLGGFEWIRRFVGLGLE